MQDFHELVVWKKSRQFVLNIYKLCKDLAQTDNFGLILNLRRSSIGMESRIAEGAGKSTNEEFDADLKRARAVATNSSICCWSPVIFTSFSLRVMRS